MRGPQFVTDIDGLRIHFVPVRSRHANALPLVLVHGWPGSFVEFMKVIDPLTEPERHGGLAADAFHVVAPSVERTHDAPITHWTERPRVAELMAG